MKKKITIGPERVDATLQPLQDFLDEVQGHGAPDDAKVRIDTSADGVLLINIEYEEDVAPATRPPI